MAPIFKKGNTHDPENYRGVSMEDLLLKIGEKLVKESIMSHLLANNMIKSTQHGFMPLKSTVSNLIEYIDDITKHLDSGKSVCPLMTDFS